VAIKNDQNRAKHSGAFPKFHFSFRSPPIPYGLAKNGLETFQELKKIRPEVRAILTTGYAVRGDTDAMFRLGLRGYQLKPYTLAELSTKISSVLSEAPAPVSS